MRTRSATMRGSVRLVTALTTVMLVVNAASRAASANPTQPNLAKGATYLATATDANGVVGGTSLSHDGYYEVFDKFADFGLTIDGAFALAATGTDNATLQKVARFIDNRDKDGSGNSVDEWTGIGTAFANGGAIGKEALLAEVVGADPRNFGGHDLIAAL